MNALIQNTTSNFSGKIASLKRLIEDRLDEIQKSKNIQASKMPEKVVKKSQVMLDVMILKDILIKGKPVPRPHKSRSVSPVDSDKENDLHQSSRHINKVKYGSDFQANYPSHRPSVKDFTSGALSEKSNKDNAQNERPKSSHRSNKLESDKVPILEELVSDLTSKLKEKEAEIIELNKVILEQHNELKAFEDQDNEMGETKRSLVPEEALGDLSVDTEDLNVADPSKIFKIVKSLRQEEHLLNQRLIVLREEIEALNKERNDLAEENKNLKKENKQKISEGKIKPKEKEKSTKEKKVSKDGTLIQSDGEEDFSNYLILKRKFDEIHAFVTRIAGLLSKSVQQSRRRHTTPELKEAYLQSGSQKGEGLKMWLQSSPSKSQIDKDSKRFYLKFKKRFDTSRPFLPKTL